MGPIWDIGSGSIGHLQCQYCEECMCRENIHPGTPTSMYVPSGRIFRMSS